MPAWQLCRCVLPMCWTARQVFESDMAVLGLRLPGAAVAKQQEACIIWLDCMSPWGWQSTQSLEKARICTAAAHAALLHATIQVTCILFASSGASPPRVLGTVPASRSSK
jgi:hypothetical protein